MIKNLLLTGLTIFNFSTFGQNFVATYGFQDVVTTGGTLDPSATPTVSGLTFGSFSAFGTSANPSASGRFSFTGWPLGGVNGTDDYSNFFGVLSPTVYYEVSVAIDPGYTLSLSSMSLAVRRSGTGIRTYCVRSDLDNYTNNLAASTGTTAKLSVIPPNVFFWNYDSISTANDQRGSLVSGSQFSALTHSVTFRFFAWNSELNGGSFSIDNVTFTGTLLAANPVGFLKTPQETEIKIVPNPAMGSKTVIYNARSIKKLEILSLSGQVLMMKENDGRAETIAIDLSALEIGICFLRLHSDAGVFMKKIILTEK